MLRWRLLLGTIFIAALIALFWVDHAMAPGWVLFPLALMLAWLGSGEFLGLVSARGFKPAAAVVYGGSLLVVASNAVPMWWGDARLGALGWPLAALGVAVLAAFAAEMRRYERPGEVVERLALAVLGVCYVGLLLSFAAQLRLLGPSCSWGVPAIASLVIVVKMSDIGAYTVGRLFGRHKMAPVLSPGKTWEGAAGGLVFACLGSWAALHLLFPRMTDQTPRLDWAWLLYGLLVGGAGMLGDLAESLIKRDVGRKDSSDWLPGFGGVLDLLDSVLLAAPVALLCWKLGLVGP